MQSRRSFLGALGAAASLRGTTLKPDLILFNGNIHTMDPSSLVTIPIERTMVGGRWMYES